jgi:hypothetical protein
MKTYKDYSPIVASFLHQMILGGWKIARVIDCANAKFDLSDKNNNEAKKIAKSEIMAGDDSTVVFLKPNGEGKNMKVCTLILLGNGADELVADWSASSTKADSDFEIYWDKFRKIWEDKEVPTKEIA